MKHLTRSVCLFAGLVLTSCVGQSDGSDSDKASIPQPDGLPETVTLINVFSEKEATAEPVAIYENNGVYALEGEHFTGGKSATYGVFYDGIVILETVNPFGDGPYSGSWPMGQELLYDVNLTSPHSTNVTLNGVYSEVVFANNNVRAGDATINVDGDSNTLTVTGPQALEGQVLHWVDEVGYEIDTEDLYAGGALSTAGDAGYVSYAYDEAGGVVYAVK